MNSRDFFCYTIAMKPGLLLRFTGWIVWLAVAAAACIPQQAREQVAEPSFTFAVAAEVRHQGPLAGWRSVLPFSHLHSFNRRR